ncbi:MAG: hypothetical protein Kow00117_22380 [Phototrophicales bacterium]|nr:MAG: hypothetical protein CUN56_03240 [Phototrophicales bacterium]RMG73705.1 MAG: hypothetical protein D6711_10440 [Chloroflexota bacterium]
MTRRLFTYITIILILNACGSRGQTLEDIPTRIPSLDTYATSVVLTENAPPEGFREFVAFPQIDDNLQFLSHWHSEVYFHFDGVFSRTPRQIDAETTSLIWYTRTGNQRRVVLTGGGDLFGDQQGETLEGVRLGSDVFLLRDEVCLDNAEEAAAAVADLRASLIVGGVNYAVPAGEKRIINGEQVWRYAFTLENVNLPLLRMGDDAQITNMLGELWVSPEHNAVIRYYLNMEVENVVLQVVDNALPVSGQLILRYDLYDIGINPNITQPFGC